MTRALGTAAVVAAAALAAVAGAELGGCGHEPRPAPLVQPDEPPPLPPASGTPIGYLVDAAGQLQLNDDQRAKLKAIDDELAARLNLIDGVIRSTSVPTQAVEKDDGKGRGLGFRAGGGVNDQNGPRGGGVQRFPNAGTQPNTPPTAPEGLAKPTTSEDNTATFNRATVQRARDLRRALERSYALMNRGQQELARRVLADRGIDPETGLTGADTSGRQPGEIGSAFGSGSN